MAIASLRTGFLVLAFGCSTMPPVAEIPLGIVQSYHPMRSVAKTCVFTLIPRGGYFLVSQYNKWG